MVGGTVLLFADHSLRTTLTSIAEQDHWTVQTLEGKHLEGQVLADLPGVLLVQWSLLSEAGYRALASAIPTHPSLFIVDSEAEETAVLQLFAGAQVCRSLLVADQLGLRLRGLSAGLLRETQDLLTGVLNRRYGYTVLERLLREPSDRPLWLAMTDLDHFKKVNDEYGHSVGDDVLRRTARALKGALPTADMLARYGGEEFILAWRGPELELTELLTRVNQALAQPTPEGTPGVTLSAGVTKCQPGDNVNEVLNRADRVLYEAKGTGRNRIVFDRAEGSQPELSAMELELRDFETRVKVFADRLVSTITSRSRRMVESAQAEADTDGLTGLYTRRYFDRRLERELERSRRFSTPLTLILLDLDDFGAVNRDYGYPAGDMALRKAAEVLLKGIRVVDWAGRYGGEELCGVFPDTDLETAREIAERLRDALTRLKLSAVDGRSFGITGSLGIVQYAESDSTPAHLIQRASDAVRVSKTTGKNRVTVLG